MRNVILFIAMSLDGYIADKDGSVAWLEGDGSAPEDMGTYSDFYDSIDTVVLGYTTYHQIVNELSPEKWAYEGKKCYVLTHREPAAHDDICFINEAVEDLVRRLKADEGGDIWICGGAKIAQALIAADLIDCYRICVAPVILGAGVPLFVGTLQKLKLSSTTSYNGFVELAYERRDINEIEI